MISAIENHPVFICGAPRSGTSLVKSLLDGHPELVVDPGESRFFIGFLPKARRMTEEQRVALAGEVLLRYYHDEETANYRYVSHIPYASIRKSFLDRLEQSHKHLADYLPAAILAFWEASGQLDERKRYWVEKTPFNELYVEKILSWWKHARFIHIVRDPRDNYAASRRRDPAHSSVGAFAYVWLRSARLLRENSMRHGEGRYLTLRYEDLVREPKSEMARIVKFLGISDDESLARPTKAAGAHFWAGNSSYGTTFTGIEPSSVNRWRENVAASEIALLETLTAEEMEKQGYFPEMPASLGVRARTVPHRLLNLMRGLQSALSARLFTLKF
jgi:hypothetical protein